VRCQVVVTILLACAACLGLSGCNATRVTIADTFPKGSYAAPWVLRDQVWSGSLARAAEALGDEAAQWGAFEPQRVWLAVYQHDTRRDHELVARIWAFASPGQARRAYQHFRPHDADALEAGDEACWVDDGILVLWGRLVLDIFGRGPTALASPEQAIYLLAFFEKRMPAGLPDDPR
jgi:hypothetical protein